MGIEPLFKSRQPDRFGVVFPDGAVIDCTEAARLFEQDAEARARLVASKVGGMAVRIITELRVLDDEPMAFGRDMADVQRDLNAWSNNAE